MENGMIIQTLIIREAFSTNSGNRALAGKRNGTVAGNGVEIFAQVVGEIHCHLPGLLRILIAEAVDAHHGIENEMGSHLKHHNAGFLPGKLPLLFRCFPLLAK